MICLDKHGMNWVYLEVVVMLDFSVQLRDRGMASQRRGCGMIWEEVWFSFSTPNPMTHRNTARARMRGLESKERKKRNAKIWHTFAQWFFLSFLPESRGDVWPLPDQQFTQNTSKAETDCWLVNQCPDQPLALSIDRVSVSFWIGIIYTQWYQNHHTANVFMKYIMAEMNISFTTTTTTITIKIISL